MSDSKEGSYDVLVILVGVVIISICIGNIYGPVFGWLLFGGSLIVLGGFCLICQMICHLVKILEKPNAPKDKEN